jgi:hypothetical protein
MRTMRDQRIARIEEIRAVLASLSKEFDNNYSRSAQFARLYFHTINRWLDYCTNEKAPDETLMILVERLYQKFDDYILQLRPDGAQAVILPWRPYVLLVDKDLSNAPNAEGLLSLFFAVRAHIRYDLAEAICETYHAYQSRFGVAPDMKAFRKIMLGKKSSEIFKVACLDFLADMSLHAPRLKLAVWLARHVDLVWLPLFQFARNNAWREAQKSISSAQKIERTKVVLSLTRAVF